MGVTQDSVASRVKAHRDGMREQGLRPVQIWVPDTRSAAFRAEASRQSLTVAQARNEEDEAFIDSLYDWSNPPW